MIITPNKKLVIFDLAGTLFIKHQHNIRLRDGAIDLLQRLKRTGKHTAISTDTYMPSIESLTRTFEIAKYIDRCYGGNEHITYWGPDRVKRLDLILEDFQIKKEHAIFIGDNGGDYEGCDDTDYNSCWHYKIDLIKVPSHDTPSYDISQLFPE